MQAIEYLLIVGFVGAVLALAAVGVAQLGFEEEATRGAFVAAFPITERVTSAVNLMLSQREEGSVEVELPQLDCVVRFKDRYVETTVTRHDATASYGLFAYEDMQAAPNSAPGEIECPGLESKETVKIRVTRTNSGVVVSEVS